MHLELIHTESIEFRYYLRAEGLIRTHNIIITDLILDLGEGSDFYLATFDKINISALLSL
jgi:hypothetical protein